MCHIRSTADRANSACAHPACRGTSSLLISNLLKCEQGNALGALDLVDYLEELADAPGRRLIPPGAVRRAMASRQALTLEPLHLNPKPETRYPKPGTRNPKTEHQKPEIN